MGTGVGNIGAVLIAFAMFAMANIAQLQCSMIAAAHP